MNKASELLARFASHSGKITLEIQPGIGAEGFCSANGKITGNDDRRLIYGVGKYRRERVPPHRRSIACETPPRSERTKSTTALFPRLVSKR
ncbi:MAG: hypothetical protein PCFJNLEI_00896 [Verrucomicrobiae bacterium]|nr:hypothetical protein [Verrucomicrobiae bacterium]